MYVLAAQNGNKASSKARYVFYGLYKIVFVYLAVIDWLSDNVMLIVANHLKVKKIHFMMVRLVMKYGWC